LVDGRVLTFANAADEPSSRQLKIITNFPELVRQKERQAKRSSPRHLSYPELCS